MDVIIDSDSHRRSHMENRRHKDLKVNLLKIKHERTQDFRTFCQHSQHLVFLTP